MKEKRRIPPRGQRNAKRIKPGTKTLWQPQGGEHTYGALSVGFGLWTEWQASTRADFDSVIVAAQPNGGPQPGGS